MSSSSSPTAMSGSHTRRTRTAANHCLQASRRSRTLGSMYRDSTATLDERDRAVGAILIGEALIASCERAQVIGDAHGPSAWRAIRDAHDDFPEIWHSLDRAPVSYTHLRAHETPEHLVCRLLLE